MPWREKTIDGVKAGDPATVLTGVAVTVAARLDNLRRAAAAGCNLVITQEPVFYGPNDEPGNRAKDPVYLAKKAYIEEAGWSSGASPIIGARASRDPAGHGPGRGDWAGLGVAAGTLMCHDPGDVLVVADGTRAELGSAPAAACEPWARGTCGCERCCSARGPPTWRPRWRD